MKYRPEIDGFRAVAVALVILFHFQIASVTGGYIGVDIFFVLSGYLISSIIFQDLKNQSFSFWSFYFRRIRRLFPVYVVVMLATLVAGYWLMLPIDFRELGKSLITSTVYISNIFFYSQSGYFDTASHLKPLLHTWSLSVEEQFYLIFPLLAWLLFRCKSSVAFPIFLVLTVLSFGSAVVYIERDTSAVFYLYPFRAWEMFLGTLLALRPVTISKRLHAEAFSLLGMGLILIPAFIYNSDTLFPGWSALLPCVGAALVIESSRTKSSMVSSILSTPTFVYIGQISYSLYLWHWPVYVLYVYAHPDGTDQLDAFIMLFITVALAALSYRYIETPCRNGKIGMFNRPLRVYASTFVTSLALVAAGLYLYKSDGLPKRLDPEVAKFAEVGTTFLRDTASCESFDNPVLPKIEHCIYGSPLDSNKFLLVWGDSHAGALMPGLKKLTDQNNVPALQIWSGGCPPFFDINKDENVSSRATDEQCTIQNDATKKFIEQNKNRIEAVLLVGRWSYYYNGGGIGIDVGNKITLSNPRTPSANTTQKQLFSVALERTIETLNSFNLKLFLLEQPPEIANFQSRPTAIKLMIGQTNIDEVSEEYLSESITSVFDRQGDLQKLFAEQEEKFEIFVIRTHDLFCDQQLCKGILDSQPAYFDNNHLSSFGAVSLVPRLNSVISMLNIKSLENE